MAAILKHWKEAASLLLIARNTKAITEEAAATTAQTTMTGRKCSGEVTIIRSYDFDYKILLQRRISKLGLAGNRYVFPGGKGDNTDFSRAWVDLYSSFGVDILSAHREWQEQQLGEQAPMLSRVREPEYSHLPADLAFRICSIRETFEELGILIARQPDDFQKVFQNVLSKNYSPATVSAMDADSIRSWKKRMYADPSQFLNLCRELRVLPDVWSLCEWANWHTPPVFKPHRFDAMFYACLLESDERPLVVADDAEAAHITWSSPIDALLIYRHGEGSSLSPNHHYEMCRFMGIPSFQDLKLHMQKKSHYRVSRWLAVFQSCSDGVLCYLPGDQNYPEFPDLVGDGPALITEASIADVLQATKILNQHHFHPSLLDLTVHCNVSHAPVYADPVSDLQVEE